MINAAIANGVTNQTDGDRELRIIQLQTVTGYFLITALTDNLSSPTTKLSRERRLDRGVGLTVFVGSNAELGCRLLYSVPKR